MSLYFCVLFRRMFHLNFIFLTDLLSDWASTTPGDVAFFMPYEWEFKFHFRNYELICIVNEHNWIDCNNDIENSKRHIVGSFASCYCFTKEVCRSM